MAPRYSAGGIFRREKQGKQFGVFIIFMMFFRVCFTFSRTVAFASWSLYLSILSAKTTGSRRCASKDSKVHRSTGKKAICKTLHTSNINFKRFLLSGDDDDDGQIHMRQGADRNCPWISIRETGRCFATSLIVTGAFNVHIQCLGAICWKWKNNVINVKWNE